MRFQLIIDADVLNKKEFLSYWLTGVLYTYNFPAKDCRMLSHMHGRGPQKEDPKQRWRGCEHLKLNDAAAGISGVRGNFDVVLYVKVLPFFAMRIRRRALEAIIVG